MNISEKLLLLAEEAKHSFIENSKAKKKINYVKDVLSEHLSLIKDKMEISVGKTDTGIFGKIILPEYRATLAFVDGYKNYVTLFKMAACNAISDVRQTGKMDTSACMRYLEDIKIELESAGFTVEIN